MVLANKLIEKIKKCNIDPCNIKEHYQSFVRKKNTISKTIKNNYSSNQKLLKTQTLLT